MADSMYCHACHHQWLRDSDAIECSQCQSASTEIVTPDDDPRHFHNLQSAATPNPGNATQSTTTPSAPDHEMTNAPADAPSSSSQDGNARAGSPGATQQQPSSGPRPEFVLVFPPPVTFFTTVVTADTHVPPPDAAGPRGPPVTTFFSMNVMPPMIPLVHRRTSQPAAAPSAETSGTPGPNGTADQAGQAAEQQQSSQSETQPQPRPPNATLNGNRTTMPFTWLDLVFGSLAGLNPANAAFGDAVYSHEALDRIISQLREAQGPGGAPPASQVAIDKLEVKELDEKMLGGETKTRCVICVDEMAVGEKASVLPCNHFFHGECVTPWLKQHNTCPVCRRSIEPETTKPGKAAEFAQGQAQQHAPSAQDCS